MEPAFETAANRPATVQPPAGIKRPSIQQMLSPKPATKECALGPVFFSANNHREALTEATQHAHANNHQVRIYVEEFQTEHHKFGSYATLDAFLRDGWPHVKHAEQQLYEVLQYPARCVCRLQLPKDNIDTAAQVDRFIKRVSKKLEHPVEYAASMEVEETIDLRPHAQRRRQGCTFVNIVLTNVWTSGPLQSLSLIHISEPTRPY